MKVGDEFLISSVEVPEWLEKFEAVGRAGFDRTPGRGRGILYRVSETGELLDQIELGDPQAGIDHPGGMDFDGTHLWVPVAQYRLHSRSNIYAIDPHAHSGAPSEYIDDDEAWHPRRELLAASSL